MTGPPRVVGIVAARHRSDALHAAQRAIDWLTGAGLQVRLEPVTAEALRQPAGGGDYLTSDLVVVFGGDGTVINALRAASGTGTPVIAVNFGTVGFLTELDPCDLIGGLQEVVAGRYEIEPRVMLEAHIDPLGAPSVRALAANDVVIKASDPTHVLEFRIQAYGSLIANFPADGLVISTPTGSTAYNLSAGGPVLFPDLPAMVVTPICPHTLATRPLVLADDMAITIEFTSVGQSNQAAVAVDGRVNLAMLPGAVLTVQRAEQRMHVARLARSSFFDNLRNKLRWGKPK